MKKLIFMGTPKFAQIILEKLHQKYPVSLVVTQPDKKVGRKQILTEPPLKKTAKKLSIAVFQPINLRKDYQIILDLKPDLVITAAYGQMLPKELLEAVLCINIHASLLPKHRGGAPVERAISAGDLKTGITLMHMEKKMDSGDLIAQREITIEEDFTATILLDKLADIGADLLLEYLPKIFTNKAPRIKQDESLATYSYNLKKADEILDFKRPTRLVLRQLNALLDQPGGSMFLKGKRIKVYKLEKNDIINNAKPGTVLSVKGELTIKTLDGAVNILTLQEQGKNKMAVKAYLNGQKIFQKGDVVNE